MHFLKKFITCTKVRGYTSLDYIILYIIMHTNYFIFIVVITVLAHLKAHFTCESHVEDGSRCDV